MIILSFKEDYRQIEEIPDSGFFMNANSPNLCFLIHGLTGTAREMASIAKRLNTARFSVTAPMMPRHNRSLSELKRASWEELYAGIKNEFLKYAADYDNIFLGGLSFGALLCLLLAYEFPNKVRAITCYSPTLFFDGWNTPKLKFLLPLICKTPLKYYLYLKEESPYGIKNERLRAKIEGFYSQADLFDYSKVHLYGYPVIPVSNMHQNLRLTSYISKILPAIKTPIQLIQAKEDDITSPENSYFIYNRIGSKDKKVLLLEDSYHIIIADQERERVAQETIDFFLQNAGPVNQPKQKES